MANHGSTRLIADDVCSMPLPDSSAVGIWVEGGWPTARTAEIGTVGNATVSVWEITTGVVADIENDECLIVLGGAGQIRFEHGEVVDLEPGVCVRLRAGDRAEWTVLDTLRAFIITAPDSTQQEFS